jgi:dihydrofolate synthase/folylpolyglutamate synthase
MPKTPSETSSLDAWLRWQEALHPQAIALGLDRIRPVAQKLGLPARGIRTITVAGTNGKGSSTALLSEIYRAAGYRTGAYTSPHLLRYNERVSIMGDPASDADLCRAFAAVERARGETPLTYFEFGTLAALWLLRESQVQLQLLEVGMGGRLDAVNLVDADCALITNIGLDHREFLGADRETIGHEKAGILRKGQAAVCVDPQPPASIGRQAELLDAKLWQLGRDFSYRVAADAWHWQGPAHRYKKLPPPGLRGEAQYRNAAGVLAAVTAMQDRLPAPESAIRAGLVRLQLPGRFERRGPGGLIVLDVAHNVEAAQVLAENLRAANFSGNIKVVLGMLSDKPVAEFCAELAKVVRSFHFGGLPGPRGLAGAELARRAGLKGQVFKTVSEAFQRARADSGANDAIVVCGSFLTVAAIEGLLDE